VLVQCARPSWTGLSIEVARGTERDRCGWLESCFLRFDVCRSCLEAASAAFHFALAVQSRLESLAVTRCDSFSTCTLSAFLSGDCLLVILQRPFLSLCISSHAILSLTISISIPWPVLLHLLSRQDPGVRRHVCPIPSSCTLVLLAVLAANALPCLAQLPAQPYAVQFVPFVFARSFARPDLLRALLAYIYDVTHHVCRCS
jgi:hypothetical protein